MHAVTIKVTGVCGIGCLACQDQFFVNNPLDVKENDEHAHEFALHLLLGGLLLCLMVRMANLALVTSDNPEQEGCIGRGNLTKLLADVDTLLLLISC
jgi:hypothetical protein